MLPPALYRWTGNQRKPQPEVHQSERLKEKQRASQVRQIGCSFLFNNSSLGWGIGGTWKGTGFSQRGKGWEKIGGERRGWITREEDLLFSMGQTGLSRTFCYGDESALRECEVMPDCQSSFLKAGKEHRRQLGNVFCQSKGWLGRHAQRQTGGWKGLEFRHDTHGSHFHDL